MKRVAKKVMIVVLSLVMAMGVVPVQTVQAATPKLSAMLIDIYKGETYTLKVTGAGKKKVTWSSSNKKVAKVSKKGVVTGVKKGNCTIYAKVGSKKLKCFVYVHKAFDKEKAMKNIKFETWHNETTDTIYGTVKNENNEFMYVDFLLVFIKDDKILGNTQYSYRLHADDVAVFKSDCPDEFDRYEMVVANVVRDEAGVHKDDPKVSDIDFDYDMYTGEDGKKHLRLSIGKYSKNMKVEWGILVFDSDGNVVGSTSDSEGIYAGDTYEDDYEIKSTSAVSAKVYVRVCTAFGVL